MWCFVLCAFPRFYIWEILHSTIRKMNKHVLKIHKELEETKARLARQHKRVSKFVNLNQVIQAGMLMYRHTIDFGKD